MFLSGQTDKAYTLDMADQPMNLSGLSFRIGEVRNETGVADGRFGTVYTGLLNTSRELVVKNGLALNLQAALLRNTPDPDLPRATLLVRYFRIDEEMTATTEHRRLQLEASLQLTGSYGLTVEYGPRTVTRVDGGLDVTSGHARALADAVAELLLDLDRDVREGVVMSKAPAGEIDPTLLPNGAFYSLADYRAGRVDTALSLKLENRNVALVSNQITYYEADFTRTEEVSRRDVRELWGYHHGGVSYLYLQQRFYSIRNDEDNRVLVAVPGGIIDPEQAVVGGLLLGAVGGALAGSMHLRGKEEFFELDLQSGSLNPQQAPDDGEAYRDRILIHHVSPAGRPDLRLHFGGAEYLIPPGEFVNLGEAGKVLLTFEGQKRKPYSNDVWQTEGRPALYTVEITDKGKIKLTRQSDANAEVAVYAILSGSLNTGR